MELHEDDQLEQARKIRNQYETTAPTELEKLKMLDRCVKAPVTRFAYGMGIFAALVMGSGMSLIMTDIGEFLHLGKPWLPGLVIGVTGLVMAVLNYPIYRKRLIARRKKYASQIMELSERILS